MNLATDDVCGKISGKRIWVLLRIMHSSLKFGLISFD